ncbi:MAG: hypothetical protein U0470_10825 [Anaerolineae bacterium]
MLAKAMPFASTTRSLKRVRANAVHRVNGARETEALRAVIGK